MQFEILVHRNERLDTLSHILNDFHMYLMGIRRQEVTSRLSASISSGNKWRDMYINVPEEFVGKFREIVKTRIQPLESARIAVKITEYADSPTGTAQGSSTPVDSVMAVLAPVVADYFDEYEEHDESL